MNDIRLPSYVQTALARLERAGFEAYAVGGCIRDSLRGVVPHDWDITTSARPEEMQRVFAGLPVIETGLRHGTLTVLSEGQPLEITTYRIDGTYHDGRHPDAVHFSDRLTEDLARRDFTVNAMAYAPGRGLCDPYGGQRDLAARVLRCVGEPARRFEEDALRILRALRFASVLGFSVEPATGEALLRERERLSLVSAERIAEELTRLLCGDGAADVLRRYAPVVFTVLPELAPLYGFDQHNRHHCYDVYEHTLHALAASPPDPLIRWAVLLHDSGKPAAYSVGADGQGHFYGHPAQSAVLAEQILTRLRFSRRDREAVVELVRCHDAPIEPTVRAVRRRISRLGEQRFEQLLAVREADHAAQHPDFRPANRAWDAAIRELRQQIREENDCLSLSSLAVNGRTLQALGIPAGPLLGRILRQLLDAVLDGRCENREEPLCALALQLYRQTR